MPPRPTSITKLHDALGTRSDGMITLDDIRHALDERAFGVLLFVAVVPCLVPIPGLGSLFGLVVLMLGIQLTLRLHMPLLPKFILRKEIRQQPLHQFLHDVEPHAAHFSRYVHARFTWMIEGWAEMFIGLFVIAMSLPIILPAPLSNFLPALALLILSFAILERDGLLAIIAYIIGTLGFVIVFGIYGGIVLSLWHAAQAWIM